MKKEIEHKKSDNSKSLREKALELLQKSPENIASLSPSEISKLAHELSVYQIEMEMQNEELRRAQVELGESQRKYSDLYDFAPVGYFLIDSKGNIVESNLTGASLLGIERTFLTERPFAFYVSMEDRDNFNLNRKQVFKTNSSVRCELKLLRKGKEDFFAELLIDPVKIAEGQINHCRLAMIDITARKQAEEKSHKLNRTLKALSRSSQIMMRASDVTKYAEDVCRIVVENCGYKMVWVGLAENDEGKSVRSIAYSGFEQGYLETLGISWDDSERGRGPTGTAIRTGQPSFCRNMLTDPTFEPWRKEAIKRGYASSVVLPLVASTKVLGAVTIYSKEPDSFSEEEVNLLSELANDLAYGIETIRILAAHAQAEKEVKNLAKFPEENPFPVLRLSADGVVLYSNSPGRALLKTWGCETGQKVPKVWRLLAKKSILSNSCQIEEMSCGDRIFSIVIAPVVGEGYVNLYGRDITKQIQIEQALLASEQSIRKKLESVLSPEGDIGTLELEDIIDVPSIQNLMDDFYQLVHLPMAIIDMNGKTLVGTGWQDICTKFHRIDPQTCRHCIESDVELSAVAGEGEFKLYKCKNNMWDAATPIIIGDKKMGNLFMGQFFFDDETLDYEFFISQARQYGFNEKEYIAALEKTSRLSRKTFAQGKAFLYKFAKMISLLSYSNIKLARLLSEREELTKSLQQSRGDLDQAQKVANIGSWRMDVHKNELIWSDENHRIFGVSKGTSKTYETFLSAIHPDDREYVDAQWQAALKGQPYDIEHRIVVNDRIKWVRERAVIEFDKTGELIGGFGTTQDITDIKQAEDELRQAHHRLQTVLSSITDGLLVLDKNWRYTYFSEQGSRMLGMRPEQLVGGCVWELFPYAEGTKLKECYYRAVETGQSVHFEEYYPAPVDKWLDCHCYPSEEGLSVYFHDITDRKRAEDALFHSQQAFKALADNAPDIIARYDRQLRHLFVNSKVEKVTGLTVAHYLGKTNVELGMQQNLCEKWEKLTLAAFSSGAEQKGEFVFSSNDGPISYDMRLIPEFAPDGSVETVMSVARDITDRKRAEEALLKSREELRRLNNELENRIRQRTTDLVKTVDTLEAEVRQRVAAEDALRSLAAQLQLAEEQERRRIAQDLHDSIGQILAFSLMKISSIRKVSPEDISKSLEEVSFHLKEAVTQTRNLSFDLSPSVLYDLGFEVAVEDLVERFARERKISCLFENCKMPKPLNEDVKVLLYRSIRELLINAAKHSRAKEIKVSLLRSSSDIYIIVEDNGQGFDASVLEDKSKKTGGFGLFSVRERLNVIGGSLKIKSAKGKGTQAVLIAPLDIESEYEKNRKRS